MTQHRPNAQVAYEAYAESVGWRSVRGERLPSWAFIGPDVQRGWKAAADAVVAEETPPKAGETASTPKPSDMPKTSEWGGGWNGLTAAGQQRSQRQHDEQDAFDRLNPSGC